MQVILCVGVYRLATPPPAPTTYSDVDNYYSIASSFWYYIISWYHDKDDHTITMEDNEIAIVQT